MRHHRLKVEGVHCRLPGDGLPCTGADSESIGVGLGDLEGNWAFRFLVLLSGGFGQDLNDRVYASFLWSEAGECEGYSCSCCNAGQDEFKYNGTVSTEGY